ncbi:Sulfur carrier protein TusA [Buchnera aphidicola (Cinara kochiana kochiana)]|uniref:Sulfur carrier protein TusA n=1 Tax=Buchnera aphidicola (Cinara kochiana kochiana) TaxID=2518976 RepID=A0A451D5Q8_9GAMM|nr:sulfurtransferase TusA [Buchnera aphidicola]VFP81190.1 Sulfur carrier protein TusA [Buchnera aphidicola (Cinara kochiana kochiana)]
MKYTLNLLGLRCPEVIMTLRKTARKLKKGQKIFLLTDDKFSNKDIILFCRFMKHRLLSMSSDKIPYTYLIEIKTK